ncbi:expressed protein [Batrachochytrium dendrobatidis JAM81]|uniref:Expressed protein n=1 Tax=Batrachochytrium dendrobatidis (strain JAM81 / FGSC 10211) TaxID=684364 RepID=F4NTK8_BATDJ|nr:uncharacterized protein BATDEDRAFT_36533 [Batrachochytrium dendrobatidis JAM81]EGF84340.1 expressed protein [Batrachochytrium dendrobatidis JAM81]|eukprot:XP_006675895.1 expressed protein [Batrachochytrium dendrobatidis JAM81]
MPESNSINTQNSPPHPPEKSFKAKPAPNQLSPTIPSIHPKIKVKPAQTTRSTRSPSPLLFDAESVEKYRPVTNGHHDYAPCKPLHSHRGMDPGGFRAAIVILFLS